jgi:hypothetical protein
MHPLGVVLTREYVVRPPSQLLLYAAVINGERSLEGQLANNFQTSGDFPFLAKKNSATFLFINFSIFSKRKKKLQIHTHNFHL